MLEPPLIERRARLVRLLAGASPQLSINPPTKIVRSHSEPPGRPPSRRGRCRDG